jgi:predicted RecB family nuclease
MKRLALTPTALSGFFACRHKTALSIAVASGELERPGQNELERKLLELRGFSHESKVLESFRAAGLTVHCQPVSAPGVAAAQALGAQQTLEAMRSGVDVVYQGVLVDGEWHGRPDFLVKCEGKSALGEHGYQVLDAKLAREPRVEALIQLCVYSEHLGRIQGVLPRDFGIIDGSGQRVDFRFEDFSAFYAEAKAAFEGFVAGPEHPATYPEPCEHCDVCAWWKHCEDRRRADDHLSLVAGISRKQRERLQRAQVATTAALALLPDTAKVARVDRAQLDKLSRQARLQQAGRAEGKLLHEWLVDADAGSGLERLPAPTPGDLFLDLEGDSFVVDGGLDYLFGLLELGEPEFDFVERSAPGTPRYLKFWATTLEEERRAFENVMDRIARGLQEFPQLHVFHFGHRESDALKRLACRHGTREEVVDQLLRQQTLVDLLPIVRQSLRASVESYTLKELEGLYGFERRVPRRASSQALQWFGWWLETQVGREHLEGNQATIELYNEDDCLSTWRLRDWLEASREPFARLSGRALTRPAPPAEKKKANEGSEKVERLVAELVRGLQPDPAPHSPYAQRRLLADLLNWHWREQKSGWWEHFSAKDVPASERAEHRLVLTGLHYEGVDAQVAQSQLLRFSFAAEQEHAIRRIPGGTDADTSKVVNVVDVGPTHVVIKRGLKSQEPHPRALIPSPPLQTRAQQARLVALADSVVREGLAEGTGSLQDTTLEFPAARALLQRRGPGDGKAPLVAPDEDTVAAISRWVLELDGRVLAVQGPPGSGKTYRAAHAIVALLRAGKRVGVTANSHAVVADLLSRAAFEARRAGTMVHAHQIVDEDAADAPQGEAANRPEPAAGSEPLFTKGKDYAAIVQGLAEGTLNLVGGTAFAWCRPDFDASVDVLFVDEAGQMSLANALAVAPSAKGLVLLGDPAQLEQPQKGIHPLGADVSALGHWLGSSVTMPARLGVFLEETRRMHPDVCDFVSRTFYEGRLRPAMGLERQRADCAPPFEGSGLRYVPVLHQGNTSSSSEEVGVTARVVDSLLTPGAGFVDAGGKRRALTAADVLVITPYNAQVAALRARLPPEVKVGTVDKFQGQEAPVVVYSMATSTSDDAPRGLEFLYSLNRLNVAISRARALVILVASPELFQARCRTPRQLKLVNALCAYRQRAALVQLETTPEHV